MKLVANMKTRHLNFELREVNEDAREATFVASTERAVPMGSDAPEVLRMSGVKLDRYRKNPVLLDSHNRFDLASVIGRTEVKVEGRKLIARAKYADTERGELAWRLVRGGFVRAMSIGYAVNRSKVRRLRKGETDGDGDGLVEGPADIVNEWELLEISNVPVPADEDAVRRALSGQGNKRMGGINYAKLVSEFAARDAGESEEAGTSDNDASQSAEENKTKGAEVVCPHCGKSFAAPERAEEQGKPAQGDDMNQADEQKKALDLLPEERAARILIANRQAALAITPRGLEEVAERALAEGKPLEEIRKALLEAQAKRQKPVGTPEPTDLDLEGKGAEEKRGKVEISEDVILESLRSLHD